MYRLSILALCNSSALWPSSHYFQRCNFPVTGYSAVTPKFGPDRCFGMIKKSYKLTYVSSIYELRALLKSQALLGTTKPRSWELTMEESSFQCTTGRPFWNHTLRKSQISRSITISDFQRPVQEWFSAKS